MRNMSTHYNFVVIEGNIGAGKTTLTQMLGRELQAQLVLEQFNENPFLPKFYQNPQRYSFTLEMSFLTERYHQLMHELDSRDMFTNFVLADYYFMKSLIFAKTNLEGEEYILYRRVFDIMFHNLPQPDLYVYLHASVEKLMAQVQRRGRSFEKPIQPQYLKKLQDNYFNYFKQFPENRFLIIDTETIDYVKNKQDYEWIKHVIFDKKYDIGINRISPAGKGINTLH